MPRTVQKSELSRVVPSSFPCKIPISSHAFRFEASLIFFIKFIASCQTPKQTRRDEEKKLGGGEAIRKGGKINP